MSLAYCAKCLVREDMCECGDTSGDVIYGSVDFEKGYRRCLKDNNLDDERRRKKVVRMKRVH